MSRFAPGFAVIRPSGIQSGPIAPLGIEFDAVGRIGDHQAWLALAQQPGDRFRRRSIRAEHSVRSQ